MEPLAVPAAAGAAPLSQAHRIKILDALRGVALLGILLMNIPYFGMVHLEVFDLRIREEFSGINYYTWWAVNGFFEGTMRAMFSMLFGAGCILIIRKLEQKNAGLYAADIYYRRLIWLMLFGMFNAFILNWPGDILFTYGLCGLFVFPFRNMRPKKLLILGLVILAISTVLSSLPMHMASGVRKEGEAAIAVAAQNGTLTEKQEAARKAWEELQKKVNVTDIRKEAAAIQGELRGNYFSVMATLAPVSVKFESTKMYKSFFWDAIAFMFLGMFLFKTGVLSGERSRRFYAGIMVLGYAGGLSLNYYFLNTMLQLQFDFTRLADEMWVNPYQARRFMLAVGHLSLIMLIWKSRVVPFLFSLLAGVGQMAFSNYLMQSIICSLLFYGYGLGLFGQLERYQLYMIVAAIWVSQIAFSAVWLRYYQFGPFEWVWRSLTYWRKQPMRRRPSPAMAAPGGGTVTVIDVNEKTSA